MIRNTERVATLHRAINALGQKTQARWRGIEGGKKEDQARRKRNAVISLITTIAIGSVRQRQGIYLHFASKTGRRTHLNDSRLRVKGGVEYLRWIACSHHLVNKAKRRGALQENIQGAALTRSTRLRIDLCKIDRRRKPSYANPELYITAGIIHVDAAGWGVAKYRYYQVFLTGYGYARNKRQDGRVVDRYNVVTCKLVVKMLPGFEVDQYESKVLARTRRLVAIVWHGNRAARTSQNR